MNDNYLKQDELKEKLQVYLLQIKKNKRLSVEKTNELRMFQEVVGLEAREGYFHGKYVKRLVVFMRGTGCAHATETGGCTFCGFYNATNFGKRVSDEDYELQIKKVIESNEINFFEYPIICLYNDGSLLNKKEISFDAVTHIFKLLNHQDSVKKIVIESRIEDITEEKLLKLKQITKKEIEIAVGFESANEMIRELCINKSFSNTYFEKVYKVAISMGISIIPLLMIKPPYLTELEAIDDYVESLLYLEKFNFQRIDIELPTVEKDTLVHELWQRGMYTRLWFWSVIEILHLLQTTKFQTPLYISPQNYSVPSEDKTSNCPNCDDQIYQAIDQFNRTGDISIFDSIECMCKAAWKEQLQNEVWEGDIPSRIEKSFEKLLESRKKNEKLGAEVS